MIDNIQQKITLGNLVLTFVSEADLAIFAGEERWLLCDCGHDCCPCDSQCK
jgi:hypothetical protein